MASRSVNNPLPPCPGTPNCIRTSKVFKHGMEEIFDAITQVFENEAHNFEVIDPKRIEIHAVYKIPVFGFKDDVDVIMEEQSGSTTVFIRSASRLGAYDLGVNRRRIKRIFRKMTGKIKK